MRNDDKREMRLKRRSQKGIFTTKETAKIGRREGRCNLNS
jgi:hypothetical protein